MEYIDLLMIIKQLGMAMLIGIVIGIERQQKREFTESRFGMRDYVLVSLLGFFSAYLNSVNSMIFPATFFLVLCFILGVFFFHMKETHKVIGITSLLSMPIVFLLSALCLFKFNFRFLTTAVFATLIMLQLKSEWYTFIDSLNKEELLDFGIFCAIAIIITPLIPKDANINLGFYVINFIKIWNIVTLVSFVSFVGYFIAKYIKGGYATLIGSFFGSLVSSLATLALILKGVKKDINPNVIMMAFLSAATGSVLKDILLLKTLISAEYFSKLLLPLISMVLCCAIWAIISFTKTKGLSTDDLGKIERPLPLKFILKFCGMLTCVIIIMAVIAKFLPYYLIPIVSFLSGMASSASAVISVGDTFSQGLVSFPVAGISVILAVFGSMFAKYMLIYHAIGFTSSRRYLLPLVAVLALGLGFFAVTML